MTGNLNLRLAQLRIKHLALLDILDHCGSLRQTAKVLCVSQPAVTVMLQDMEALLKLQLVERGQHGARLTSSGEVVRDRLRLVLNALNTLEASIASVPIRPHLKVGVLAMAMLDVVPRTLMALHTLNPEISYEFIEGTVEELLEGVLAGNFDCAIGRIGSRFDQDIQNKIEITKLHPVPLRVACCSSNPLKQKSIITLEELQHQKWILLPNGTTTRAAFEQAFFLQGLVPPSPNIESLSFLSNFHLVANTTLLTLSTATAIDTYVKYGLISSLPIVWPINLSPLMFFCRKEGADMKVLQTFRIALENTIAE